MTSHKSRRLGGWTVLETLIASVLGLVVLGIVTATLASTSRFTKMQSQVSFKRSQLMGVSRHLERSLSLSTIAGVSWLRSPSPDAAVLACHCLDSQTITTTPKFEPYWRCFIWDVRTHSLYYRDTTSIPSITAPPTTQSKALSPADLATVLSTTAGPSGSFTNCRLLAEQVTSFKYLNQSGPLFYFEVELQPPLNESNNQPVTNERFLLVKTVHPRNRV